MKNILSHIFKILKIMDVIVITVVIVVCLAGLIIIGGCVACIISKYFYHRVSNRSKMSEIPIESDFESNFTGDTGEYTITF